MNSHISKLRNFFIDKCKEIDKKIIRRKRSLDTRHLLAYLFQIASDKLNSGTETKTELECENITSVSKQAIEKKLDLLDSKLLNDMLISLHEHINESSIFTKAHIYAVDGTKISLNKKVPGFHITKNGTYKKALINTLYSVNNKVPIAFDLSDSLNEIGSFIKTLLQYVKKGDIVIFDRGYYSKELIKLLNDKGCFFICRMRKSSLLVNDIPANEESSDITKNLDDYGKIRIIKYTINKKSFYLSTNILSNVLNIDFFKEMYHNRWYIEEFYKTIKHDLSLNGIAYKKINRIEQNINIIFILALLTRYLEAISIKYIKKLNENYAINHKNALQTTGKRIIYQLLFKKSNNKIIKVLGVINKTTCYVKANRKYKRIRITPPPKWYSIFIYLKNT